jgi:hypothetical protein
LKIRDFAVVEPSSETAPVTRSPLTNAALELENDSRFVRNRPEWAKVWYEKAAFFSGGTRVGGSDAWGISRIFWLHPQLHMFPAIVASVYWRY